MKFLQFFAQISRQIKANEKLWATAINLGTARCYSNKKRWSQWDKENRNKNRIDHIVGAAAELAFLDAMRCVPEAKPAIAETESRMYDPAGGANMGGQADFRFYDESSKSWYNVEIKSMDCAPHKSRVLIGVGKWEAVAPGYSCYVVGLAPYLSRHIALSANIPLIDVLKWRSFVGSGDPRSREIPIDEFVESYMYAGFDYDGFRSRAKLSSGLVESLRAESPFYEDAEKAEGAEAHLVGAVASGDLDPPTSA